MIPAVESPEIAERIRQLQRERGGRQHVWTLPDGSCAACGQPKTSFSATQTCAGAKG